MEKAKVEILLALYNGEKYLEEMIKSILAQSYENWVLKICDDFSTDNSLEIAKAFEKKYPDKIFVSQNEKPSGSAVANFSGLLKNAANEYIMFADQDDIWLSDKILTTLEAMQRAETDKNIPILVHSDLSVVDEDLNEIAPSFFNLQGLKKELSFNEILVQNNITGCTAMINRALCDLAKSSIEKSAMHDWWLGILALPMGKVVFIDKPLIKYRQHNDNSRGARNSKSPSYILKRAKEKNDAKNMLSLGYKQAKLLLDMHSGSLDEKCRKSANLYASLLQASKLKKWLIIFKFGFWKTGIIRRIGQLLYC